MKIQGAVLALGLLIGVAGPVAVSGQRGGATITRVAGDVYRASNGAWHSIFLVTPEGILVGDTLNTAFATQLKAELHARFPGIPEALDYEILAPALGVFFTPDDVSATREYFEYLTREVDAAYRKLATFR